MTTKAVDRVQVTVRSMVCTGGVGGYHGTGTEEREYVVPGPGRGNRRPVRPGDHLPVDHPLVLARPHAFAPSGELPDVLVVGVLTAEALELRQAQRVNLDAHPAVKHTPCCARCGQEYDKSVVLLQAPTELDRVNALTAVDPHDYAAVMKVESSIAAMARAAAAQQIELDRIDAEWRSQHPTCPPGTPELPTPQIPPNVPLYFRRSEIRSAR